MDKTLANVLMMYVGDNTFDDILYGMEIDPVEAAEALMSAGLISEKQLSMYLLDEGYDPDDEELYGEEDEQDD